VLAVVLQLAAGVAARRGDAAEARLFLASADGLRSAVGAGLEPTEERVRDRVLALLDAVPEEIEPVDAQMVSERASAYLGTIAAAT
jgi:hypothetical protein